MMMDEGMPGCGHHRRFCAADIPCCAYPDAETETAGETLPPDEEVELLRSEAERMRSILESIEKRLEELERS